MSISHSDTPRAHSGLLIYLIRAWLPLFLLLAAVASPVRAEDAQSAAGPAVAVEITGDLTEAQRRNILAHLSLVRTTETGPLSETAFNRLYIRAVKETAKALEPFGYYGPRIVPHREQREGGWQVRLEVVLGEAVVIDGVDITVSGAGEQDQAIREAVRQFPLRAGMQLDHRQYEEARDNLITTAINNGYLKASYRDSRVEIRKKTHAASVRLVLATGPRYQFGTISFDADFIDHDLLHKISPAREGDPLTPGNLARLRRSLFLADYFTSVDLEYDLEQADPAAVPVRVLLKPNLAHRYGIGLGYGTDTGIRGTLEYTNRHINRLGHQLNLQLQPSERKSNLSGAYSIPIGDPLKDRLSILGSYEVESYDNIESTLWKAGVSHDHFRDWGEFSTYLQYLDEEDRVGEDDWRASLLIPGVKGSLFWTDNRIVTTRGLRLSASVSGAEEDVLADASFLQATAGAKAIYSFFDAWRLIGRADGGYTMVDETDDLPLSLRFFAGGDQSVRGYGYKKIGPKDAAGNIIGGKYLFTYSLELERTLFDSWSGAVFYDSGMAANSLSNVEMQAGAGVGLRWNGPFGQIRLDVAQALDESGSWRIHFTLGADL